MNKQKVMRLTVACLVAVAMVKVLFWPSSAKSSREKIIIQGDGFWAKLGKAEARATVVDQEGLVREKLLQQINGQTEEVKGSDTVRADADERFTAPLKVVHLDLKGAAPKVKYLEQIFPLLSALGADGILLEYEDMFPYDGELEVIRSSYAYSLEDIETISALAKLHKLVIIPLVQVFGHMEFVLKHQQFLGLREVETFPNSLSPLAPGSVELVKEMIRQVLRAHPEAAWFHVGADEVHGLGQSEASKRWLESHGGDMGKLFLNHVTNICSFLTLLRPGVRPLLWDDMFRTLSADTIRESGLQSLASLMIWNYTPNLNVQEIGRYISKLQEAGFRTVWFASAFKGASGIDQTWTPIQHHLKNQLEWVKVIASMPSYPSIRLRGIALTGWQRYEHYTVLCELLPVALPSLAVCLQTLRFGSYNAEAKAEVNRILGCEVQLSKNDCKGKSFPGSDIYEMVKKINNNLASSIEQIMQSYHVRGSFSPYNRKRNFANPRNLAFFRDSLKKLMEEWDFFLRTFRQSMEDVFFPDTVEEWMEEKVNQHVERLSAMVVDVERIIKLKGQPRT